MDVTKVALVGLGTVGSGVARILLQHPERVAHCAGSSLQLARVVVRDLAKPRDGAVPRELLTDDLRRVTADPEIRIVAQLVGGVQPALDIMRQLLENGKDVVTANKALLAAHGSELFELARRKGRCVALEASVGGGIPIIANLSQCLTANQILSVQGILNGTCNFIITQMEEEGWTYTEALREAQQRGYAEADPAADVDGSDAAQKLAILAHLAFGARPDWNRIPRVGIQTLDPVDLHCAREMGYCIKLLSVARRNDDDLELHVSPTLVRLDTPLAEVRGAYNAVEVVGDAVGRVFYHGLGAGQMPTASAVVADLIDIAAGRMPITFRIQGLWSAGSPAIDLANHARLRMRYYLRFRVLDRPGVLADISGVLGRHQISVASVIQHEWMTEDGSSETDTVSLVIMTHTTTAGAVDAALLEIERLRSVRGETIRMPVQDSS